MPHSKEKLLEDVLIAIKDIESFSKNKTFDDYKSDKLLQSAIGFMVSLYHSISDSTLTLYYGFLIPSIQSSYTPINV